MKRIKECRQCNYLYRQGDSGTTFYTDEEIVQKPILLGVGILPFLGEESSWQLKALGYNNGSYYRVSVLYKVLSVLYILSYLIFTAPAWVLLS